MKSVLIDFIEPFVVAFNVCKVTAMVVLFYCFFFQIELTG